MGEQCAAVYAAKRRETERRRYPRPRMTNPDDRMLWIRNLKGDVVSDGFDAIEVEVGSECRINGILDYEDGAILLGASTHDPNNVGLYKYLMKLKLRFQPARTLRGKPNGYLFRDGQVGELVALISLCLQARLYILSITVGHLTSHGLPIKTEFSPLRVRFGRNVDPVVFSATDRNFAIELPSFLDQVRHVPSEYHLAVALSSNHFARALREIGVDEEMVFVRLVSAIETAALDQPVIADELSKKTPGELFRTEDLTALQIQELKKLLRTRKAKARFIAFLEQFSSGFFEGMPEKPPHTQVTPTTLASVAGAIYDARSDYLHNGYPMYLSQFAPAFPEWHMDPSVGMVWQNRSYAADQKLPRADFFHRLVRHCLLSYFKSLVPGFNGSTAKEGRGGLETEK